MNDVATAVTSRRAEGEPPSGAPRLLRRVQRGGYAVLGIQLVAFLVWSAILYSRFAVTWDFTVYHQAWFLIAHGNLDPYSSTQNFSAWRDHSQFLLWPLALGYWVWPSGVTLLWLQDLCVAGAEAVAFTWLCEVAGQCRRDRDAAWLAGTGLVLLAANPWIWWTVSFDVHIETFGTLFAVLLAGDLARGRRRALAWILPLLACGDVAGTYLAGIGLGVFLLGRRGRRGRLTGAGLACLGLTATLVITIVHGNLGSGLGSSYGYLAAQGTTDTPVTLGALVKGIASHPLPVLRTVWAKRLDVLANLGPSGFIGVGDVLLLPLVVIIVLANILFSGLVLAEPIFQYLPVYVLLPVGTVVVLRRLSLRRRVPALLLAGLLSAQALGWCAVWGPRTPGQWLRVSGPAAATLAAIAARIPASAEVVASNGIVGRFSGRPDVQSLAGSGQLLRVRGQAWFVITPAEGIEKQSTASAQALIGELAGPLHATLVTQASGVWAFRWTPPPEVHEVTVPDGSSTLPAWAAAGTAGRPALSGPVPGWHMAATGGKGYVSDGLEWREPPGRYRAAVTLSASGPVNVEVWDDTTGALLARRDIPATRGIEQVTMPVTAPHAANAGAYSGAGPFRASFVAPPAGQQLEVRVWSPGHEAVNVYTAELADGGRPASLTAFRADRQRGN
jgi:uncharacterized membrane protein